MRSYLRNASPEVYLLFCSLVAVVFAAAASRIPSLGFGFVQLLVIFVSFDVLVYIAMKAGWIRTPRQRSGVE